MKTGIILLTHGDIGKAMIQTAHGIMQGVTLDVAELPAPMNCDCDAVEAQGRDMINRLDQGQGVLILNDICGATPYNIASRLVSDRVKLVSGINLNMLLRAVTYQELPVAELAEKAREGGTNGVRCAE